MRFSVPVFIVAMACGAPPPATAPDHAEAPPPAETGDVQHTESHALVRDGDGRAAIVARTNVTAEMRVVAEIETAQQLAKLDRSGLLRAATGDAEDVVAFVQLDEATAPSPVKDALAGLGFAAGTVAGDVVTGRARLADLGALVAAPWVVYVEFGRSVHAR